MPSRLIRWAAGALTLMLLVVATVSTRRHAGHILKTHTLTLTDGTQVLVGAGHGPTLLVFWSTHCDPCLRQIPQLVALAHSLPKPRQALVAVAIAQDDETTVQAFAGTNLPYSVARDRGGVLVRALHIRRIPTLILIGPRGHVRLRQTGSIATDTVRARFLKLLDHGRRQRPTLIHWQSPDP